MRATVAQVREGLRAALQTIDGFNAYAKHPDTVIHPAGVLRPTERRYHDGQEDRLRFELTLYVQPAQQGSLEGQEAVDPYLDDGTRSIRATLEDDPTLGGVVDDVVVEGWRDYDALKPAGGDGTVEYWGARVDISVLL